MSEHGQSVRPLLVEDGFEQMRHQRRSERCQQDVGAGSPLIRLTSGQQPPSQRDGAQDVFIRAPGHRFRSSFNRRGRVAGNLPGDKNVCTGR